MRKFTALASLFLSLSFCLSGISFPHSVSSGELSEFSLKRPVIENDDEYIDDEIIVVTDASIDDSSLQIEGVSEDVLLLASDAESKTFRIVINDGMEVDQALDTIIENPSVEYAQPNYQMEENEILLSDGQTKGTRQWHHEIIHTKEAWELMDKLPDRSRTKVAIIDGAVDVNHPDLRGNIDLESSCSLANGFKEDITSIPADDHATHVAGIIAAVSDNEIGIDGVASGSKNDCVQIISINVFKKNDLSFSSDILISALDYAVKSGSRVINMSLGGYYSDLAVENAVNSAFRSGAVVICGAGNKGVTNYILPSDASEAISVINLNFSGSQLTRFPYSDYGKNKDLSAPGTNIYSSKAGGAYG